METANPNEPFNRCEAVYEEDMSIMENIVMYLQDEDNTHKEYIFSSDDMHELLARYYDRRQSFITNIIKEYWNEIK